MIISKFTLECPATVAHTKIPGLCYKHTEAGTRRVKNRLENIPLKLKNNFVKTE